MPEKGSPRRRAEDRWGRWDTRLRSTIIFFIGIAIAINEAFLREEPELYMLIFSLTLMGIPPILKADELLRSGRENDKKLSSRD